jgi:hypothetical protein
MSKKLASFAMIGVSAAALLFALPQQRKPMWL